MSIIPHTTSSTRPAHAAGKIAFETDTGNLIISDGTSWRVFNYDEIDSGTHEFTSNNYSAYFDGTDDYIGTGNKFDFIQQTCTFTVTCWAKWTNYNASTSENQSIIASTSTGSQKGLYFYYDSRGGTRNLKAMLSGNTAVTLSVTGGVGDNNWHHYAISSSGSGGTFKLYKDGSVIASGTSPTTTTATAYHTMNLGLGSGGYGYLTDAYLDEVAIFNRELTSTEIDNIIDNKSYDNFSAMYRLENNAEDEVGVNNGTVVGGVTFVSKSDSSTNTPY